MSCSRGNPRQTLVLGLLIVAAVAVLGTTAKAQPSGHTYLYFDEADLPALRDGRWSGRREKIWQNVATSAEECLTLSPRTEWIPPVVPDPIYENLFDRNYAILSDMAVTEHLGLAYALSGDTRYGDAARDWTLASARVWQNEAAGAVDGSKAYSVSRLLKAVAVGYNTAHDRFSPTERDEVLGILGNLSKKYYDDYFSTPGISGPGFFTHHAIVEWASFGVAALAQRGVHPEAQTWIDATTTKFENHLLPWGLTPPGHQAEGPTFWASTMHYRMFYMDALRNVTGQDLYAPYEQYMNSNLPKVSVATGKYPRAIAR